MKKIELKSLYVTLSNIVMSLPYFTGTINQIMFNNDLNNISIELTDKATVQNLKEIHTRIIHIIKQLEIEKYEIKYFFENSKIIIF